MINDLFTFYMDFIDILVDCDIYTMIIAFIIVLGVINWLFRYTK